jgi:hypothetical protein
MNFCGQCGFQLAPNDIRCPNCGASSDSGSATPSSPSSEYLPDDATIASPRYAADPESQYDTQQVQPAVVQQKLVLGPGPYPTSQQANEATAMISAPSYPPIQPPVPYPPQYPPIPQPQPQPQRKSPRATGLIFIFLGLLLILSALVLFALQHNGIIGGPNQLQVNPPTSVARTPIEQARSVVTRYYANVNARDYLAAYRLWKNNTEKFADFRNGYHNTQHTEVTFGAAYMQSATVAYLPVTVTATEINPSKQSTYNGYYTVERQNDGTWLILDGNLTAQ